MTPSYRNHAWILLFVSSAVMVLVAVSLVMTLSTTLPGLAIGGLGIFGTVVAATGFRNRRRWAWYTLWYVPAFALAGEVWDIVSTGTTQGLFVVVLLSLAGLLLPYRAFFPKNLEASRPRST